jgi:putative transposase
MEDSRQGRPRGEQAWSEVVARQAASGLSVPEFCRREGLKAWSLYDWRSRLRARSGEQAPSGESSAPGGERQPPRSGSTGATPFIDLGAIESGRARCEVRIELGGGVVLHVVRG